MYDLHNIMLNSNVLNVLRPAPGISNYNLENNFPPVFKLPVILMGSSKWAT